MQIKDGAKGEASGRAFKACGLGAALPLVFLLGLTGCATSRTSSQQKLLGGAMPANKAVQTAPFEGSARLKIARSFQDAGDYTSALRLYQAELAENPKSVGGLAGIGELYATLHAYDPALESFRAALAIDPKNAAALLGMGQVLMAEGKAPEAVGILKKAALANPDNPRVYNSLGLANDLLGDHEKAQIEYGNGLDHAPGDGALTNNLALSFVLSKNYETAIRLLSGLVTAEHSPKASRQNLATAYALSGDTASAENLLKLEMTPDEVKGRLYYYRRLAAASPEEQTKALFLGVEPAPKVAAEAAAPQPAADSQQGEGEKPILQSSGLPLVARADGGGKAAPGSSIKPVEVGKVEAHSAPEVKPRKLPKLQAPQPGPLERGAGEPPLPAVKAHHERPKAKAEPASKRYSVQLGAYKSENYAMVSWRKLIKSHPQALAGYSPALLPASLSDNGDYVRLYLKEVTARGAAEKLCNILKSQQIDCLVRQFPATEAAALAGP